jgi:glycine/D-amino acid oxidase-like deaminating enzyme
MGEEERAELASDPELAYLTRPLPGGVHFRPEGGRDSRMLLLLFTYHLDALAPVWPPKFDPWYPEVALRAVAQMVPGFAAYLGGKMRRSFVDGGYYCKTAENRLLVGPTPVAGFHLMCGLSGYGIMAAAAAAELLGADLSGGVPARVRRRVPPRPLRRPGLPGSPRARRVRFRAVVAGSAFPTYAESRASVAGALRRSGFKVGSYLRRGRPL